MEAYSQTRDENRWLGQGAREPARVGANKTKEERIVQRERF